MKNRFKNALNVALLAVTLLPSRALFSRTLDDAAMAERVKEEFLHAWNGYKTYAWGHDELKPVTKEHKDWHEVSLHITALEALDTMIIMGLDEEADITRDFIARNLSFDHDINVKVFEINIRALGSLLSCYQLTGDKRLLNLAEDLGNRLVLAFSSPTGMPYTHVNLRSGKAYGVDSNPAEVGTYIVEFGTLSKLTGNPIFFKKAKKALVELYRRRSDLDLVGAEINVQTGRWTDDTSHVGGGADSYYEYLLKCALLFDDDDCRDMWETSIEALHNHAAQWTDDGLWYGRVDMHSGEITSRRFSALDAFFAGALALDGNLRRAASLQGTYFKVWKHYDAMPESLSYASMSVIWGPYLLRPEAMESAFYLYRLTNDRRYLEMGRTFFEDLVKHCRTEIAYGSLADVEHKYQKNEMESFFLAETLKYLYLIFAPKNTLDLSDNVFNTEAHPIKKSALRKIKSVVRDEL